VYTKDESFDLHHYRIVNDGKLNETIFPSESGAEECAMALIETGAKVIRIFECVSMMTESKRGEVPLKNWL